MSSINQVAALIHKNCADEQMAQKGYQELIDAICASGATKEQQEKAVAIIQNIQKDEFEHSLMLMNLAQEFDYVTPTSDEAKEALNDLTKKVGQ